MINVVGISKIEKMKITIITSRKENPSFIADIL